MHWNSLFALSLLSTTIAACGASSPANPNIVTSPTAPTESPPDAGAVGVAPTVPGATAPNTPTTPSTGTPSDGGAPSVPGEPEPVVPVGLPVAPSSWGERLSDAGLDINNLPPLNQLTKPQLKVVMHSFNDTLGVRCDNCHADHDFKAPTAKKNVAIKMWDLFARGLQTSDGKPVYCDSCHNGSMTTLDREDPFVLGEYMKAQFVNNLKSRNGQPQTCATCHGKPFVGGLLDVWAGAN